MFQCQTCKEWVDWLEYFRAQMLCKNCVARWIDEDRRRIEQNERPNKDAA